MNCTVITRTGSPCRNHAKDEWDHKCFMHWARDTGRKMPQSQRKTVKHDSADAMLLTFGMGKRDLAKIREAFPQIDQIIVKETSLEDAMDTLARVLMVRSVANPTKNTMDGLLAVMAFLKEPNQNDIESVWT